MSTTDIHTQVSKIITHKKKNSLKIHKMAEKTYLVRHNIHYESVNKDRKNKTLLEIDHNIKNKTV